MSGRVAITSCPLLGKAKIVAFFNWKFRSFAFGKMQKIGYKNPMVSCPFYHWVLPALRAANFHIAGQKAYTELGFPWAAASEKSRFPVWSCLYEEVRTYFEEKFKK